MSKEPTIHQALVAAQREFAPALKVAMNPHLKSRYADLASCVNAVVDALNNHGLYLLQRTETDAEHVSVTTVFIHESGEQLECGGLVLPVAKKDPQGFGSAITYARRYSLMSACGIAPEDDDGHAAGRNNKPQLVSAEQVQALTEAAADVGADLAGLCKYLRVNKLADLPADRYQHAVKALDRKRKAAEKPADKTEESNDAAAQ